MDAAALARAIRAEGGGKGIISVGGDGTAQEVVTGMLADGAACEIPLGIISVGSGNDLTRTFFGYGKKTPKTNTEAYLARILEGHTRAFDAIRVTGTDGRDAMAYLNISNIGLDERIVHNAIRFKPRFKKNAYLVSAFVSIVRHKNTPMRVTVYNGKTERAFEGPFTLAAVCNGVYYGGAMPIAPSAKPDDGLITLCLADKMSSLKALPLFPTMLMAKHTAMKSVNLYDCERVVISLEDARNLCMDGNLYEREGELTFDIIPAAVKVFIP
jgi:diacylglycerol kinase (ATP)